MRIDELAETRTTPPTVSPCGCNSRRGCQPRPHRLTPVRPKATDRRSAETKRRIPRSRIGVTASTGDLLMEGHAASLAGRGQGQGQVSRGLALGCRREPLPPDRAAPPPRSQASAERGAAPLVGPVKGEGASGRAPSSGGASCRTDVLLRPPLDRVAVRDRPRRLRAEFLLRLDRPVRQIGRASCRERVLRLV